MALKLIPLQVLICLTEPKSGEKLILINPVQLKYKHRQTVISEGKSLIAVRQGHSHNRDADFQLKFQKRDKLIDGWTN